MSGGMDVECDHDDYEVDLDDDTAKCDLCGYTWRATERQIELQRKYNAEEKAERDHERRVDIGYQRAKDGEGR